MGSGASSLNDEQRAHVAKLMKEHYDKVSKTLPQDDVQSHMEKFYGELISSLNPPKPLDAQRKEHGKKKVATRRRSYGEEKLKKKDLPPKAPVEHSQQQVTTERGNQGTETHRHEESSIKDEVAHHIDENVDSWDSVHSQPSCPLCKLIFTTTTKYETHVKYSEVHAQNLAKQKQQVETALRPSSAPTTEPPRPISAPPGPRCRELYTGSKFFWRYKQTVEIHIYLHLSPRCLEVCSYNNNQSQEYPRVYLEESKLVKLIGDQSILDKINDIKDNIPAQEPTPPDEILEEEAKRLLFSAHIMNRLQFGKDIISSQERVEYSFTINPQFPEITSPLLDNPPQGVIPVMIARRRLSTSKEIENAFASFNHLEAELLTSTEKAEKIIDKITQENEDLFKQNGERRHSK